MSLHDCIFAKMTGMPTQRLSRSRTAPTPRSENTEEGTLNSRSKGEFFAEPNVVYSTWNYFSNAKLARSKSDPACAKPSHLKVKLWQRPGSLSFAGLVLCCSCLCLDCLSLLPHPMLNLPGGLGDIPDESIKGLTQSQIRNAYHKRLNDWKDTAEHYKEMIDNGDLTLVKRDLPERSCNNCSSTPLCRLAEASVKERYSARVHGRRCGTAKVHLQLMVRDYFKYGYGYYDVITFFKREMRTMRKQREKNGQAAPTEEDVCHKVLLSSTKANQFYDSAASRRDFFGYVYEAVWDWKLPTLGFFCVGYALEFLTRLLSNKLSRD